MSYRRNRNSRTFTRLPRANEGVWRYRLVQIGLYMICSVLLFRLVQIQVLGHEKYSKLAREQYLSEFLQKAERGLILDRHLKPLALNRQSFDLGLDKRMAANAAKVIRRLAEVLNKNPNDMLEKSRASSQFVLLERKISLEQATKIKAMRMQGIKLIESPERVYPLKGELAQVLGFVDTDGKGLSGLELQFEQFLKGKDGWRTVQKDATGKNILPVGSLQQDYDSGNDVILTIDNVIQSIVEDELSTAVSKFNAKGGSVIITRPQTGEILAMTSRPGFDANMPGLTNPNAWRNRAITDIFEPGSTFKIVTMMAALSNGIKGLNDIIFCENGKYRLFGETINDPENHGWLSFRNVFKYSSNIGTAKIAMELGKEKLYKAARSFGFGNQSGIELPGEVSGILKKPSQWSRFSVAAISYGHEVAVTPLQMAMAYGAIANGGLLMKPGIVKEIKTKTNDAVYEFRPESIRQVMSPAVAQTITEVLRDAVNEGTGENAKMANGFVAGKTGTAQKLNNNQSGYSDTRFVASFAGFYPAEDPEYLIFLCIDEPFPIHSGGMVAAPTFKKILQGILDVYKEDDKPERTTREKKSMTIDKITAIPDLTARRTETAVKILNELDVEYKTIGEGSLVVGQEVSSDKDSELPREVSLVLSDFGGDSEYVNMPDLKGLSMRRAISELAMRGVSAKVFGSGVVFRQVPAAGEKIKAGARCMLEFKLAAQTCLLSN